MKSPIHNMFCFPSLDHGDCQCLLCISQYAYHCDCVCHGPLFRGKDLFNGNGYKFLSLPEKSN